jgi:SAM-dependent methyltransferase
MSPRIEPFYEVQGIPVHNVLLLPSCEEASGYPKGNVTLGFCAACGFIQNTTFDASLLDYSPRYEDSQAFSPTFNAYALELAASLDQRHELRDRTVLEIGCGKGDFLKLLCESAGCRGIGFDPTFDAARTDLSGTRVKIRSERYTDRHADIEADLYCCRHTLEHIPDVRRFLEMLRTSIGTRYGTPVVFEVPDVARVLSEQAFWDVYYEHCSYFSAGSLARLFRASGFEVTDVRRVYADQYLLIEARAVEMPEDGDRGLSPLRGLSPILEESISSLAEAVNDFQQAVGRTLDDWRATIQRLRTEHKRVAVWGSGAKAVGFLATLNLGDEIGCVVDINPHKHGKFQPGTGHLIVAPEYLTDYRPDAVIVMNPIYIEEIRADLSTLQLHPELMAL